MAIMPDYEYLLSLSGHGDLVLDAAPEGRGPEAGGTPAPAANQSPGMADRIQLSV